jgi:hypothetical protein
MHDDKHGRKMNIDLDSWEAGYADGQHGRSPQCAIGLDQVSYFLSSRWWFENGCSSSGVARRLCRWPEGSVWILTRSLPMVPVVLPYPSWYVFMLLLPIVPFVPP